MRLQFCSITGILYTFGPQGQKGSIKGYRGYPKANEMEAVSVGVALACMNNEKINTAGMDEWLKDKELLKNITGATNSKPRVIGRIEFCRKSLRDKSV